MPSTWDKPAGVPVFPPHDQPDGDNVLARLLAAEPHRGQLPWPDGFAGGIAHRLDTSTSGALLVAEDPTELAAIREAFASHTLRKVYLLRSDRRVPWSHNVCDRPLAHDARRKQRMIVQRGPDTPHRGRWYPAHTELRRRSADVWEVVITTGVMHQIRAHAAFVGLPILGDRLYGGGPTPPDAPPGLTFYLHHVGLEGPGVRTEPVPAPSWARSSAQ